MALIKEKPKKFIILGQDGAIPYIIEQGIKAGYLKNFKRIKEKGVFTPVLPHPSSVTPGNWAAIATGAPCGKIGISDFTVHIPGEPLNQERNAFDRNMCQAEFIWDTLSKRGMKVATISYPGSRPRGLERHVAIGGEGMPSEGPGYCALTKAQCFITPNIELADPYQWREHQVIQLKPAKFWKNIPEEIKIKREFNFSLLNQDYLCLVYRDNGEDAIIISKERNFKNFLAKVKEKQWSSWIKIKLADTTGAFRIRPIKIECAEPSLQLYVSPVNRCSNFSDPAEYGDELTRILGVYQEPLNISALLTGWIDPEGLLEEFREQAMWQARAAVKLTKDMGFTGVLSKWHAFDKFYHFFFQKIDPAAPNFDKEQFDYYESIHKEILRIADEMVGYVLEEKEEQTVLVVCSDHGLMPSARHASVANLLVKHGFTALKEDEKGNLKIDWTKTKAVLYPFVQIWINLKGRDPEGIVEPGAEYERIREEIVKLLRNWKDPKTGEYVMSTVFKTEDGAFYGLGGERDGDIRFFTSPGYSVYRDRFPTKDGVLVKDVVGPYLGDHGSSEPTARFGRGSETAMLGLYGPGIKPGFSPKLYPRLIDIMPTICYLCGFPMPANSEGGILREAMID